MPLAKQMRKTLLEFQHFRNIGYSWSPKTCEKLEAAGLVEKRGNGRYYLTEAGEKALVDIK